jgi:hypothetical protein
MVERRCEPSAARANTRTLRSACGERSNGRSRRKKNLAGSGRNGHGCDDGIITAARLACGIADPGSEGQCVYGSGCSYPSVYIQVMSMPESGWKRWLDGLKDETLEPVSGIGDEAFIRDNKKRFAELCAKVGGQVITVQYDLDENQGETTQSAKPRVIALAKALAAKL